NEIARALISMMAGSTCSNHRPDTLMQDRIARIDETSCTARPDHTSGSVASLPQAARLRGMSAMPSIATESLHRNEPTQRAITGREQVQQIASLFDQLVGGHLHDQRHRDAECLRRFEIDDEFDLGRLHHRKVCGLLTLEDAIDIEGRLAERV